MPGQIAAAYVAVAANTLCTGATVRWFGGDDVAEWSPRVITVRDNGRGISRLVQGFFETNAQKLAFGPGSDKFFNELFRHPAAFQRTCHGHHTPPVVCGSLSAFEFAGLTSVRLGSGVTTIGSGVFVNTGLTSVTIGSRVKTIGFDAFRDSHLTSVRFTGTAPAVGADAFAGVAPGAKAYRAPSLKGYGPNGAVFHGLIVAKPVQ